MKVVQQGPDTPGCHIVSNHILRGTGGSGVNFAMGELNNILRYGQDLGDVDVLDNNGRKGSALCTAKHHVHL